jgi:protein unc-45
MVQDVQQRVEAFKKKGNDHFQKVRPKIPSLLVSCFCIAVYAHSFGNFKPSQSEISQAVEAYSHGIKEWKDPVDPNVKAVLLSNRAACYLKNPQTIQLCVDDCTEALEVLEHDDSIRCKLLFRRSKALFLQSEEKNASNVLLLNEAARDLLTLLSLDSGNVEAATLLRTVRAKHSLTKGTPVSQTLVELEKAIDDEGRVYQLKVLLGLLTNDASTALELGRRGGTLLLLNLASVKSMQALACACSNPKFVREYGREIDQRRLVEMVQQDEEDVALPALSILLRLVLYLDDLESLEEVSLVGDMHIVQACTSDIVNSNTLLPARLDLLCSWTAVDRESVVQASTETALVSKKTEAEQRAMKPREVAAYKKNLYERLERDRKWAKERALLFCEKGGLEALLSAAVNCEDHSLRKHVGIVVGRLMASIQENEDVEKVAKRYLGSGSLTIEEISEEKTEIELSQENLQKSMKRLQLTSSLLLGSAEVGSWALDQTKQEIRDMISSGDPKAMGIASEVVSAAASIEKSRPAITLLFNNGVLDSLLEHPSHDIRSGAASAVAKLGLADKVLSANEGEVIGLLQIAVDLLNGEAESQSGDLISKANRFGANSTASTAVERGIEIICYLASKTQVKEELAHSYKSSPVAKTTALESLVELANREGAGESISAYALATIFGLICVSSETLRKEAFIGKEVTMEQYDELQKLGKTEEEKEATPNEADDTQTAVDERISILANANVPRALVKLMDGASETTVEQIVIALNRMAIDVSVRGLMIQQGALSACIQVERGVSLYSYLQC